MEKAGCSKDLSIGLSVAGFYGTKSTSEKQSFPNISHSSFKTRAVKKKKHGRISKNVSHKIRKPKVSKAKKKVSKVGSLRTKTIKRPSRLATNRSILKVGKKVKSHKLASPGVSLLDQPDSKRPSPQKFIFTSRSTEPAVVSLSKTIKLSSLNGEISMNSRQTDLPKKNIGRMIEMELDDQISSGILNISTKENVISAASCVASNIRNSIPEDVTSPVKKSVRTINNNISAMKLNLNSPKRTNSVNKSRRISPRKSQNSLSVSKENTYSGSPKRRVSPRKLIYSGKRLISPRKFSANDYNTDLSKLSIGNLSADWNDEPDEHSTFVTNNSEDEILLQLLSDDVSSCNNICAQSTAIVRSPRRSPRKEMKNVKYFPVFEHRRLKIENKLKKQKTGNSKRLLATSDPNQMTIDAGQSLYGAVHCKSCGFLYEAGDPSDEKLHNDFHHGLIKTLIFNGWKNERQITNVDKHGGRILKIMTQDPSSWWRKVHDIIELVDMDLGFVEPGLIIKERSAAFLYVKKKIICGCIIVEEIDQAFKFIQEVTGLNEGALLCCSSVPQKAFVGVSRIWVSVSERRAGIASALMDAMRSNMYSCHYLTPEEFAFSDPTEKGMNFAKKYTKVNDFLVYRRSEAFLTNNLS